jgi:hypothetical protein
MVSYSEVGTRKEATMVDISCRGDYKSNWENWVWQGSVSIVVVVVVVVMVVGG